MSTSCHGAGNSCLWQCVGYVVCDGTRSIFHPSPPPLIVHWQTSASSLPCIRRPFLPLGYTTGLYYKGLKQILIYFVYLFQVSVVKKDCGKKCKFCLIFGINSNCGSFVVSVRTWWDGSSDRSLMVDPLSYLSFQLVLHEWLNCFYLTTHSTHFIYGYMASDIW